MQGCEPDEGLADDLQEGDVDEDGEGEGEEEVVDNFSVGSQDWPWRLRDHPGQEESEGGHQAGHKRYK